MTEALAEKKCVRRLTAPPKSIHFRWSFGRKSQLSLPKTHPHELMVKTSTRGTGRDFIFGRDNH